MRDSNEQHNLLHIILVHVARTWERIRLRQPYEEMPQDNIMSADSSIPEIAYEIYKSEIIQKLIHYKEENWCWRTMTKGYAGMSDIYIEKKAEEIIYNQFLTNKKASKMTDNRLIAEFMDLETEVSNKGIVEYYHIEFDSGEWYEAEDLPYDEWNWLMPVVSKILTNENLIGYRLRENIMDSLPYGMIDDTYDSVVEFIKWYNIKSK